MANRNTIAIGMYVAEASLPLPKRLLAADSSDAGLHTASRPHGESLAEACQREVQSVTTYEPGTLRTI